MIHRYWTGEQRPLHRWTATANEHLGQVTTWTLETLPDTITRAGTGQVQVRDQARHEANIARWGLLYEHGGVWVDNDVILLLDELPAAPWCAALGPQMTSCAVGLPAGHSLAARMLERGLGAPPSPFGGAPSISGDRVLNEVATDETLELLQVAHDARGQWRGGPILHLWETSFQHYRPRPVR